MIKKQNILFICIVLIGLMNVSAQELNCSVKISTVGVQSDKTIFDAMEKSVTEFMNNTKWTNDVFGPEERIDCSIFINVSERVSSNEFKASMQVQARRPVYNSKGLTLNGNIFFDYKLKKGNSFELSIGAPFIVRDQRPDGLTRRFVTALEYRFNF